MPREAKTLNTALTRARVDKRFKLEATDGSLQNVVAGLGTDRDKMSFTQYVMPIALSVYQLTAMYRASWLARKTIDIPAQDMTREWRTVKFDDGEGDTKAVKKRGRDTRMFDIENAEKKLGVQKKFKQAIAWGRLYGGAVLIMGTGRNLDVPLDPEKVKKGDLKYLLVVDKNRISPVGGMVKDPADPDFGLPEIYMLHDSTVRVHHTRVIRFGGSELPWDAWMNNGYWDDSVLQSAYTAMLNADSTTASIATMMFEANVDVVKAEGLADLLAKKNGEAILTKRFQTAALLKSYNRMLLLDGTEEYEKKSNSFANLDNIMTKFMINYSGAVDIPVSRFYGQSATGLNATGDNDIRNYYDSIKNKQRDEVGPNLEKFDAVFIRSTLGTFPDDYRSEFNSLWQMTDTEKAEIQKKNAERDKIYIDTAVITEGTVAKDLKENGVYKNLTDEDVAMVDELSREAFINPPEPVVPGADPNADPAANPPQPAAVPAKPGATA
jgi:phage-related protein (TIGR01555 family)